MITDLNILIIDEDDAFTKNIANGLKGIGINRYNISGRDINITQLAALKPDIVILGSSLDSMACEKFIHKLNIINPSLPIISSSEDWNSMDIDDSCFLGIQQLSPSPGQDTLKEAIESALKFSEEDSYIRSLPVFVGRSRLVNSIRKKIRKVADTDITVLITGETGTGKELIARAVHYYSPRNEGPLVKVDCASLPDELLESEVFGFQKGAFTDAYRDKPGRLELADEGTLFIDEIGDLSLSLQVKFLQVLEDKTFARLGGTEDKQVDARVVAATNSDLWKKVREGVFRKDLFFRLKVMNIESPPLRQRREDIPLLIHYFLNKYSFEFKKDSPDMPPKIWEIFLSHRWPGNVRELENMIKRAIAMRDWGFVYSEIDLDAVDNEDGTSIDPDEESSGLAWDDAKLKKLFIDNEYSLKKITKAFVSEAERRMILRVLEENRWNRTRAAQVLGTSYRTLLSRIEEFGLKE